MKRILTSAALLFAILALFSCSQGGEEPWTEGERQLITVGEGVMRVLTVEDTLDLAVLRAISIDLPVREIASET